MKEQELRAVVHSRIMAKKHEVASAARLAAEGGIASEESAVAEPEIGASKGPAEEHEKEPAESAAAKGDSVEAGCPMKMSTDYKLDTRKRCGRKIHIVPDGVDERPVCLMHSKDPCKQSGPLFDAFRLEFERILKDAGDGEAHFEGFVFPCLDFRVMKFLAICRFDETTFTRSADFGGVTFTQYADFTRATFSKNAEFGSATFAGGAEFHEATFSQEAYFVGATFTQDASFCHAVFEQLASFTQVTFTLKANFNGAMFRQNAAFLITVFRQEAHFIDTTFRMGADFPLATFTQNARFESTKFHGTANWRKCKFIDQAEFRGTKFVPQVEGEPSAVFVLASFSKPGEIVFDDVDLSRALFHNCDINQIWFTSSVTWGKRKGNRGLAVLEETIDLKQEYAEGLLRVGERDYRAVAQIYQQLKKNYDSRLDYWTANEFHYGEMEMKRLAVPTEEKLHAFQRIQSDWLWQLWLRQMWLRQWWHRNLSFAALYRLASDYGNSYGKPLLWLLGILVFFAALFPLPGLIRQGETTVDSYVSRWDVQKGYGENLLAGADLAVNGLVASVDTATFQRNPKYEPAQRSGWFLARVEMVLTSSLFALFLLAIRRQFRR